MGGAVHRRALDAVLLDQVADPGELPAGQSHGTARIRRQGRGWRRRAERPGRAGRIRRFGGIEDVAAALGLGGRRLRLSRGRT